MLSLTIPVATMGAAEATAYITTEDPYLAAGWEAASAEMYFGWTTAINEATKIGIIIGNRITNSALFATNYYLANKPYMDHIFQQFLKGMGFKLPGYPKNCSGLIAYFTGKLIKDHLK